MPEDESLLPLLNKVENTDRGVKSFVFTELKLVTIEQTYKQKHRPAMLQW